jgi:hypothetical protein
MSAGAVQDRVMDLSAFFDTRSSVMDPEGVQAGAVTSFERLRESGTSHGAPKTTRVVEVPTTGGFTSTPGPMLST